MTRLSIYLWAFIGIFLTTWSLFAENFQNRKFRVPIYSGFNFARHESNKTDPVKGFTGIAFGFGIDYRFLPKFHVGIDILFITKAYQVEPPNNVIRYDPKYLQMPLQLKFQPKPWFFLHAGPYLASLAVEGRKQSQGSAESARFDFNNDYGMTVGFWIGISANPRLNVGVNLRYDFGLADIENDNLPHDYVHTRSLLPLFTMVITL